MQQTVKKRGLILFMWIILQPQSYALLKKLKLMKLKLYLKLLSWCRVLYPTNSLLPIFFRQEANGRA